MMDSKLSEICRVLFQNKFEKIVHLIGFIIRIYHEAWSSERQILPEFSHMIKIAAVVVMLKQILHTL
jgi:hypothetical protein